MASSNLVLFTIHFLLLNTAIDGYKLVQSIYHIEADAVLRLGRALVSCTLPELSIPTSTDSYQQYSCIYNSLSVASSSNGRIELIAI